MASGNSFLEKEIRIVLIGITGSGKSSTGNSILGRNHFVTGSTASSVTSTSQKAAAFRFDRDLIVVDTPGIFDTGRSKEDISNEILKCIAISAPGPHAFILVVRIGRFTKEESETVNYYRDIFGKDMIHYLFVVFTCMDDLEEADITLEEYLENAPSNLKDFIQELNGKYTGINNRAKPQDREKQVEYLINMIKSNIEINNGSHYTTEMLSAAEQEMRKREEEILKEKEEEKRKKREEIEKSMWIKQLEIEKHLKEENEKLKLELQRAEEEKLKKTEEPSVNKYRKVTEQEDGERTNIKGCKNGTLLTEYENKDIIMLKERLYRLEQEKRENEVAMMEKIARLENEIAREAREQARDEAEKGLPHILEKMLKVVKEFIAKPMEAILNLFGN